MCHTHFHLLIWSHHNVESFSMQGEEHGLHHVFFHFLLESIKGTHTVHTVILNTCPIHVLRLADRGVVIHT